MNVITRSGASPTASPRTVDAGTLGTGWRGSQADGDSPTGWMSPPLARWSVATVRRGCISRHSIRPRPIMAWLRTSTASASSRRTGRLTAGNFALTGKLAIVRKTCPPHRTTRSSTNRPNPNGRQTATRPSRGSTATRSAVRIWCSTPGSIGPTEGWDPYASDNAAYPVLLNRDGAQGIRWNAGIRLARQLPRSQTLTAGGEFYDNVRQNQWNTYNDPSVAPPWEALHGSRQSGVYVQDEIRVRPWLLVNGGVRYDRYARFGRATPARGRDRVALQEHLLQVSVW